MEFETVNQLLGVILRPTVKIYSVGIWNLELSTLKNEDIAVKIYSVGIWNALKAQARWHLASR